MTQVLRRSVMVAGSPGRALREMPAGTVLDEIDEVDLAQLHPDHFVDVKLNDDGTPGERTGNEGWVDKLGKRISKLAEDLRELDGSPGVDSSEHIDNPDAFAGHPDEDRQRAAREAEKETSK